MAILKVAGAVLASCGLLVSASSWAASPAEISLLLRKTEMVQSGVERDGHSLHSYDVERLKDLLNQALMIVGTPGGGIPGPDPYPGPYPGPFPTPDPIGGCLQTGCEVLETVNTWSIQRIVHRTYDQVQLANGSWYSLSQVSPLLQWCEGLRVNEQVLETVNDWSIREIRHIASVSGTCKFEFDNGSWYELAQLVKLVDRYREFHVGDRVLETVNDWTIRNIQAIGANGKFLLDNGSWYDYAQLRHVR